MAMIEEATKASILNKKQKKGLKLAANAVTVLEKRYLRKDDDGNPIERPEDMFRRVANNIAEAEKIYDKDANLAAVADDFYELMTSLDFLPNSPTLMNAGRELQQLSACFVLPVEDSMESIFDTIRDTALIHKSGGGTGFSFSRLRPSGDIVRSTAGVSSGPVSFMKVFNSATEAVKQGGTRRGANMGILRVDHPDILNFIQAKDDNTDLENFNISVALTEEFMEAVGKGEKYSLHNPRNKEIVGWLEASEVFELIVDMAWRTGDPGIIFIDRINKVNPTPQLGEIESTNPCGEQPLLPHEACNLGSVNLFNMIKKTNTATVIDYEHLRNTVHRAVHFLDNVIDMNNYPTDRITEMAKGNRKIGLGVMGFADMLISLGIAYDSDEGVRVAEEVMRFIDAESKIASAGIAEKRGAFPNFPGSMYDVPGGMKLRNATTTTIAPTGTLSIIASCSSGVEPLFALAYVRNVMDNARLVEVNPVFEQAAKDGGFYSADLMAKVAEHGTLHDIVEIPDRVRQAFKTAHDVVPIWHIKMQGAFQKFTDNAVSKTVNFSSEATRHDVKEVYQLAYELDCKGVTIYRDGSKDGQVLTMGTGSKNEAATRTGTEEGTDVVLRPRPRPTRLRGITTEVTTGCGKLYVTINEDEQARPFEIFTTMGKAGGCEASQTEATSRLISQSLRAGMDPRSIVKQLIGIRCNKPYGMGPNKILSCSDAIAKVLLDYVEQKDAERHSGAGPIAADARTGSQGDSSGHGARSTNGHHPENSALKTTYPCPECSCELEIAEGCEKCHFCGYSKCD